MTDAFVPRPKMRRRKRATDGQAFNNGLGDQLDALQPLKDSGLFCKECRRWQRWKDLTVDYGLGFGGFVRMWFCNKCGHMVKEETL